MGRMPAASPARTSARTAALVGLAGLASAMGIGRFAFTPLLPLMQEASGITLAQGGSLAAANYLGYLLGAVACTIAPPAPHRAARAGLVAIAVLTAAMGVTGAFGAWVALRVLAGVASAFVLVGISAWALPLLAAEGRASWSGRVYTGVGAGIFLAGLVGLGAGVSRTPPARAWLFLGAVAAVVALVASPRIVASAPSAASGGGRGPRFGADAWRLVLAYGLFGLGYIVPATFLPATARQLVSDPGVFGWAWPVFGLAAAASTLLCARYARNVPPRRLWVASQLALAAGVIAPALRTTLPTLLFSAVAVGGTFMVVTMAGLQEARAIAGPAAARLMAAMTAAFALGQLVGPFTVRMFHSQAGAMTFPGIVAAAALVAGALALGAGAGRARASGDLSPTNRTAHDHAHARPDASRPARADG